MPSKVQVDENLVFLYRCLVNSDCKTIDFNKVGVATNLKAPAARMRYSRLKKNIEDKLGEGSKKAPASSTGSTAAAKVTSAIGSNKKRKASYEDENEQMQLSSFGNKIGNATASIKLQEDTIGPRTRAKRIDLTEAFKSDSDSSSRPGLGDQDDAGDDDYEMEDISNDEEDFHPDETTEDEDNHPASRSKSRGQSAKRKTITVKSTLMAFKKSSKAIPRSVPDISAREIASGPGMPVTPESAVSSRHEINGKNLTLPPTPISIPTGVIKQEPADSSPTVPKAPSDTAELSAAAVRSKKTSHPSAKLSLFDRIENARIRADHNLASLSYNVNKNSRSPGPSQWITSETVLPSIEHDAEQANVDSAMVGTSGRAHAKYSTYTGADGDDEHISEEQESTAPGSRSRLSAPLSLMSDPTAATIIAPETAQLLSSTPLAAATPDSCTVQ